MRSAQQETATGPAGQKKPEQQNTHTRVRVCVEMMHFTPDMQTEVLAEKGSESSPAAHSCREASQFTTSGGGACQRHSLQRLQQRLHVPVGRPVIVREYTCHPCLCSAPGLRFLVSSSASNPLNQRLPRLPPLSRFIHARCPCHTCSGLFCSCGRPRLS